MTTIRLRPEGLPPHDGAHATSDTMRQHRPDRPSGAISYLTNPWRFCLMENSRRSHSWL